MNRIPFIVLSILAIMAVSCYGDDDPNRYISLVIQDALVFQNDENYTVGDTLYIELDFDRYLDEEGYPNKLDVYESSGAESFWYDFALNRSSDLSNGFQRVEISPEFLLPEKGTVNGFGDATAQLNPERTRYESRIGLILAEEGTFELDLLFISLYSEAFFDDRVQIEIQHTFSGTPPSFQFTVTAD